MARSNFHLYMAVAALLAIPQVGRAQMVTGRDMTDFSPAFGLDHNPAGNIYDASLVRSSISSNILWPGDRPEFTIKIENHGDQPLQVKGRVEVVAYGTKGKPGDVWVPTVYRIGDAGSVPVSVDAASKASAEIAVKPDIPARFGAYALVVDLGPKYGRRFIVSCVRTFKPSEVNVQYPALSLDNLGPDVLSRLGVHAIRWGLGYKPTTSPDFEKWYQEQGAELKKLQAAGITVLAMAAVGDLQGAYQPLGRGRPWLDAQTTMIDAKEDYAWLPSYDPDFRKFMARFCKDYGWPRGPITACSLWNEPWEGVSISGWGADMLRYREIYTAMANGVNDARADGADVLIGGCDSSSNALDKLFPDGKDTFLPNFDFLSVHYQGMASFATHKDWVDRKSPHGRVKIWDTESWVANTDDRVAAVVAANRSAGYDRAMGIFGGNISDADPHTSGGSNAWSVAASVGAVTHFVGERPFKELLFKNGLPWVMVFDGSNGDAEDGTVVVVGDLAEEFGANNLLFRTARGLNEVKHKEALRKELASLTAEQAGESGGKDASGNSVTRKQALVNAIAAAEPLTGASMSVDGSGRFSMYDFYGNKVADTHGKIEIPLDGRGFFLRGGGHQGDFAALLNALRKSSVSGIEPLAVQAHDFTGPIDQQSSLRLILTNVLNRSVSGTLDVSIPGLTLANANTRLSFAANETKQVDVKVASGKSADSNTYPLTVRFDAGRDGVAIHHEDMHADVIARRTITVDGKLDDWTGVLPQTIVAPGNAAPTLTEAAWFPFKKFDAATGQGVATGYLAYDDKNFYFAAKVADTTPDGGTMRFATRDDDQFFYPEKSYQVARAGSGFSIRWTGFLTVKQTGSYAISTVSDDGVRLFLDNKSVIDNWTDHGSTEDKASLTLEAGHPYPIKMEYYQGEGDGVAQLNMEGPSTAKGPIPADLLTADDGKTAGLSGHYFIGRNLGGTPILTRIDPGVGFHWHENEVPDPAYKTTNPPKEELDWPEGVRRFSYRMDPVLPAGNAPNFDNVQIAFNVLSPDRKEYYPNPPGTMPDYTVNTDSDYEYALNEVAAKYGGGTEIWRLHTPGMPRKHFYPRQPKSPMDGPVTDGKLVVTRDAGTRTVEASIPWSELPDVKQALDAGRPIKFSYRVNDNAGVGCMELSRDRSVAKHGGSFHVDWVEHWENQVEFGWGK